MKRCCAGVRIEFDEATLFPGVPQIDDVTSDGNHTTLLNVGLMSCSLTEQAKNFQYEIDVTLRMPQK
jgi:hypothetical protein